MWQKLGAFAAIAFLKSSPVMANFQVCNQTLDVANIAIGQWDFDDWESTGWWIVGPNQCANVIEKTLTARFIYVYARDVFNNSMLEGTTNFCLDKGEFRIRSHDNCLTRGHISAQFEEIDTRRSERWTFFIVPPLN
jgi:uncharacterized membrane protein